LELVNEVVVPVAVDEAWKLLLDIPRIAPCMPGAALESSEGDTHNGIVKVKVGPITAQYKGKATITERDERAKKVVVAAEGRETRGQGNARATVTATLEPDGSGTKVRVVTDLTVTGRVAQFGRGVMADVSNKLFGEFVDCLQREVLSGNPGPARDAPPREVVPVDLMRAAGAPVAKRVVPAIAVLAFVLYWFVRRRRKG
jgi:carbon monoxide dehydrogenase subunit G